MRKGLMEKNKGLEFIQFKSMQDCANANYIQHKWLSNSIISKERIRLSNEKCFSLHIN